MTCARASASSATARRPNPRRPPAATLRRSDPGSRNHPLRSTLSRGQDADGTVTDYAEDHARARLRSNRALATGLLLLSGAILIGTYMVPEETFAVLLARAASEAGIVGGLADWFAVSALFRRPLGLPIPHTAIIPRN